MKALFFGLLLGSSLVAPARAGVIFVDASALGAGDGSSWSDAFTELRTALPAAQSGDELWVAEGVYTPAPPGDTTSSFELRSGVALYGGFAGHETERTQRNVALHPTILSGDVGQDDTYNPGGGWPGGYSLNTANSGHVVVGSSVTASARLDGFTIVAGAYGPPGTPAGDPLLYGSGLYIVGGSPTIVGCTFLRNLAAFGPGGAVYVQGGAPGLTGCLFESNYVHLGSGGAIYVGENAQPTISDCAFRQNVVTGYNGSEGQGGAVEIRSLVPVTIERCLFEYNEARPFSAGSFEIPRGGAISCFAFDTPFVIRNCRFRSNRAAYGSAVFLWSPTTLINCLVERNTAFTYAGGGGASVGGEGAVTSQWTDCTLVNCTVAFNNGQEAAGVRDISGDPNNAITAGSIALHNTIVWGNVASGQDVSPIDAQIKGNTSASYACIQDLFTPVPGEDPPDPENYPGCIAVDPQFASLIDLHLAAGSPCVDAGRNAWVPAGVAADLDGAPRFVDQPDSPDTGLGTPPLVDKGCFERQPAECSGDIDGDNDRDLDDLLLVLGAFGEPGPGSEGDADGDGDADLDDLLLVLGTFGLVCP